MHTIRNVKMLTLVQLITMIIVFMVVFIYNRIQTPISHSSFGMVDCCVCSAESSEGSSVLIDGQIIKEGEKIYGATVTKIYGDKVEFEKDGKRWEQRVQEQPNLAWEEPNQL